MSVRTHYDNLMIARNATPEVIRAAYKALCQKHHPDRNPGSSDAVRITQLINAAYEVLSNPERRREHDLWIAQREEIDHGPAERQRANEAKSSPPPQPPPPNGPARNGVPKRPPNSTDSKSNNTANSGSSGNFVSWVIIIATLALVWFAFANGPGAATAPAPSSSAARAPEIPPPPAYVRAASAPNGQPWPSTSGYVRGYARLMTTGHSWVTIDNASNSSDAFVKLINLDGARPVVARVFLVAAFGSMTVKSLPAGTYQIRYRDLESGALSQSDTFSIDEHTTDDGVEYTKETITLYKVAGGTFHVRELDEASF